MAVHSQLRHQILWNISSHQCVEIEGAASIECIRRIKESCLLKESHESFIVNAMSDSREYIVNKVSEIQITWIQMCNYCDVI